MSVSFWSGVQNSVADASAYFPQFVHAVLGDVCVSGELFHQLIDPSVVHNGIPGAGGAHWGLVARVPPCIGCLSRVLDCLCGVCCDQVNADFWE